jgi:DNA-binding transcriptional MocR family regulator
VRPLWNAFQIEATLLESGGSELSDRFLAEYLDVSYKSVAKARRHLESRGAISVATLRACADGAIRNIERIGPKRTAKRA